MIENLVFGGGGIKGFSFIGCLKALEELNILKNIKAIAGTSVGALFSFLILIGYKSYVLEKIFTQIKIDDFQNFEFLNFSNNFGFDNGNKIILFLTKLLKEKELDQNITFLQLFEKTNIKFIVTGTNISKQKIVYFNYETYPEMKILEALRITMSIPLVYEYVKFNNDIYVDGGLLDDYPIDYFRSQAEKTIGFLMFDYNETLKIEKFDEYLFSFLFCLLKKVNKFKKKIYKKNTIFLKQDKVGGLDFFLSIEDKKVLLDLGYKNTIDFFSKKKDLKIDNELTELLDCINN
jgi:NTE family protein